MTDEQLKKIQENIDSEYSDFTAKHDKHNDGVIIASYKGDELGIRSTEHDYDQYEVSILTNDYVPVDFINNMVSYMNGEEEQDDE